MRLVTPTRLNLVGLTREQLQDHLQYIDRKLDFEIRRHKENRWFIQKYGEEAFKEKLDELKAQRRKSLLFEDDDGLWTYSGLGHYLATKFDAPIENQVSYPKSALIRWENKPEHDPRPYQLEACEKLLAARHAGVEIGTGLGKSFIIALLLKELALPAVVMAPSTSIARQLFDDLTRWFGRRHVGLFGDGRKDINKTFTVAISKSLANVTKGSKQWDALSAAKIFIADESHLCPAETLAKVCLGLMAQAPYRFFFSGTQMRNDGLDLLLDAITGPIVYRKTVREGVDEGYLAKPVFRVVQCRSKSTFDSFDANEMSRRHMFYNPIVNGLAGDLANKFWGMMGRPVLIMVEEVEQMAHLLPYLKHPVKFAHGGLNADNRDKVPQQFWESDPKELVAEFNSSKLPILVGTSCIGTGTDIRVAGAVIDLQGGKSEIKVRQVIGRGTRGGSKSKVFFPDGKQKLDCFFVDFDVENVTVIHRHAEARQEIYDNVYGPVHTMRCR